MPDMDLDDPLQAGVLLLFAIASLIIAIGLDARKLPPGKVKLIPWGYVTITLLLVVVFAGRHFAYVEWPTM